MGRSVTGARPLTIDERHSRCDGFTPGQISSEAMMKPAWPARGPVPLTCHVCVGMAQHAQRGLKPRRGRIHGVIVHSSAGKSRDSSPAVGGTCSLSCRAVGSAPKNDAAAFLCRGAGRVRKEVRQGRSAIPWRLVDRPCRALTAASSRESNGADSSDRRPVASDRQAEADRRRLVESDYGERSADRLGPIARTSPAVAEPMAAGWRCA